MKKIPLMLITLGVIGALGYGGYSMVMKLMHKEVYGIILVDKDGAKLQALTQQQEADINQKSEVTGKWVAETKTLALTKEQAEQLIRQKALKSVTQKGDDFDFTALQQIDGELPILYSKNPVNSITDTAGAEYPIQSNKYVVLGESSNGVSAIAVLNEADYNSFNGEAMTVQAIDQKVDASKALSKYTSAEMLQIYDLKK
ncbi:lipoprotein BA_5634 family protein [uncultured Enterococcus sp.]|uniref:lipoprotein BA_5634 family protein n=1 Tax=uncultured Enterococcus sp. TaxID=167972 RepID=UPI002AA93CA2|nr:lipoprotein BA_5634 family protein [uncultured Enterococcus sp.]